MNEDRFDRRLPAARPPGPHRRSSSRPRTVHRRVAGIPVKLGADNRAAAPAAGLLPPAPSTGT